MSSWLRSTLAAKPVAELGTVMELALADAVVEGVEERSLRTGERGRTLPGDCIVETVTGRPREGSDVDDGASYGLLLKRAVAMPFESLLEAVLESRVGCEEGTDWAALVGVIDLVLETPDSLSSFLIKLPNIFPGGLCCILMLLKLY